VRRRFFELRKALEWDRGQGEEPARSLERSGGRDLSCLKKERGEGSLPEGPLTEDWHMRIEGGEERLFTKNAVDVTWVEAQGPEDREEGSTRLVCMKEEGGGGKRAVFG